MQRAIALSSLTCVDAVVIFDTNPLRIMRLLHPDIYAKGGDYTLDTLDKEERQLLESQGTRIHILPQIGDLSTTKLIERLRWNH
jgi:bifunctional ADP-heptose synthase (sugar kinase/adenylyltransferase)